MDFKMKVSVKKIIMGVMACFGLGQAALAESIPDFKNMLRAAEQGDPEAQLSIGAMYANGQGISQDNRLAVQWFRKAAEQENAKAQFNLGVMYQLGQGVGQDYVQAAEWYRKAAEQGDTGAQNNLGMLYQNGQGVSQD